MSLLRRSDESSLSFSLRKVQMFALGIGGEPSRSITPQTAAPGLRSRIETRNVK
jgi:hypothetical protein